MDSQMLSIVNFVALIFVIVYSFVLIWRVEKDAPTVGDLLHDLLTNHTAVISISRIDETSLCVSVVADWTGYTEQCFFNETMEGAVAMALAKR